MDTTITAPFPITHRSNGALLSSVELHLTGSLMTFRICALQSCRIASGHIIFLSVSHLIFALNLIVPLWCLLNTGSWFSFWDSATSRNSQSNHVLNSAFQPPGGSTHLPPRRFLRVCHHPRTPDWGRRKEKNVCVILLARLLAIFSDAVASIWFGAAVSGLLL